MIPILGILFLYAGIYHAIESPRVAEFRPSMKVGDGFCHAPDPSKTNEDFAAKALQGAECKKDGLCLSKDGERCVSPSKWGIGPPP